MENDEIEGIVRPQFVLITPAHNEAATLPATIDSVVRQTVRPVRWVIVSDRSTDETDRIAQESAAEHDFIRYVRLDGEARRSFASKVYAVRAGAEALKSVPHDFIGNLDADITFGEDYFERLFRKFADDPNLGIAGGLLFEADEGVIYDRGADLQSVGGGVQMFRRACWDEIGGYLPLKGGHEDATALFAARRNEWRTQSFFDLPALHHRKTSSAGHGVLRGQFRNGMGQYLAGWSLWYVLVRAVYRLGDHPLVTASLVRTAGYLWACVSERRSAVPPDLQAYIRQCQHERLRQFLRRSRGRVERNTDGNVRLLRREPLRDEGVEMK